MYGTKLINARQLADALGVCNTTLFKMLKQRNQRGDPCPFHQLGPNSRKYYVLDEVQQWIVKYMIE